MRYRVPSYVEFGSVEDEVVLRDARSEAYLGLNPTAALVWCVLVDGGSEETAAEQLVDLFEVTMDAAQADAAALIRQLVADGLLETVDG